MVSRRIPIAPRKAGSWKQTGIFVRDRTDGKHMWVDRLDFCDGLSILAHSLDVKTLSPSLFLSSLTLHLHGRSGMTVYLLWAEQTKLWRWMFSGFKPPTRSSFSHYTLQQPKFSFCSDKALLLFQCFLKVKSHQVKTYILKALHVMLNILEWISFANMLYVLFTSLFGKWNQARNWVILSSHVHPTEKSSSCTG